MMSRNSFGFSPTFSSTSTPRWRKIWTAAEDNSSAIRTLGISLFLSGNRVLGGGECPVEPGHQLLHIGALNRRAAPDAQSRRRIAIGADVEGDALLLQQARNRACRLGLVG